jgi:glycosyltransferase involved in cell wall biosynthesis
LVIPFKTYFCGQWIRHCGWWPGYTMPRVLKKGRFRFREKLHGGVEVDGRELALAADERLAIDHFSYTSVEHYLEKFNRYTSTEAGQLAVGGTRWDWRLATRAMIKDLWLYYEAQEGWKDGARGWILSWLSGLYRWASHAKLIDADALSSDSAPTSLDEFFAEVSAELGRLRGPSITEPFGVLLRSPIEDPSGYAEEGRCLAKALALGERPLAVEAIRWSDRSCDLTPHDRALLRALQSARTPPRRITITNCIPTLAEPDPGAAINILRTTFETKRIPAEWLPHLQRFDELWVMSHFNREAFIRSGIAPEKVRVISGCIDVDLYQRPAASLQLPAACHGRLIFLSVFDWQRRKGWDVLLRSYVREFMSTEGAALLLKVTRGHGHPRDLVIEQIDSFLRGLGTSLARRPDIVLWDAPLSAGEMISLYHSVDVFVLPTRGEGLGRPFMEAMACGLPVLGTASTGNADFMSAANSLVVTSACTAVDEAAAREIPVFRGHDWYEPSGESLRGGFRRLFEDDALRRQLGEKGRETIRGGFGLEHGCAAMARALDQAERSVFPRDLPAIDREHIGVEIQGELFSRHSFANINEQLTLNLHEKSRLAVTVTPRFPVENQQDHPLYRRLLPFIGREVPETRRIVIRHAYPPDFHTSPSGKWVHIQPWEFGHLPRAWLPSLRERVDEIWAPSEYVKRVYERSGIDGRKIHVIPWGVDPEVFHSEAIPRHLPTEKRFRFLYVGGTIARKGFDLVLQAYLAEFTSADDVSLVIKDVGVGTVYRYSHHRDAIRAAQSAPNNPEILYFEDDMTPGQLASLYRACDCLLAPYRGEGFGMPILEAMACGLPPVVPIGGPSDDFVDETCGYPLPAAEVPTEHPEALAGPALEFEVDLQQLKACLRSAATARDTTRRRGDEAALRVRGRYSWKATATAMERRILALASEPPAIGQTADAPLPVSLFIQGCGDALELAQVLGRCGPYVGETFVELAPDREELCQIAGEYAATVIPPSRDTAGEFALLSRFEYRMALPSEARLQPHDWLALRRAITTSEVDPGRALTMTLVCGTHVELFRKVADRPHAQ